MKVILLSHTIDAARLCGEAAAVCTASGNPGRSLRAALASGHESVLEHVTFTFRIAGMSRAAMAQLTRHRLASFDVESQRYVKMQDVRMVMPDTIARSQFLLEAEQCLNGSMELYRKMVTAGIPAEDARYVTPQAVVTNLLLTMNARELRHFFRLRCCNRAQWEIRGAADAMLALCKKVAPELFFEAGPTCVGGNCMESCPCSHPRNGNEWDALPEQAVLQDNDREH